MYLEQLKKYAGEKPYGIIAPPAVPSLINETEKLTGLSFPPELRELLAEADGDGYLLFSASGIKETHDLLCDAWQDIYPDIGHYLFFAENGCGDYYGYYSDKTNCTDSTIFLWEHESGERSKVADSMTEFIDRYYNGEI